MKTAITLVAGAAAVAIGIVAFAMNSDESTTEIVETQPIVEEQEAPEVAQLVEPEAPAEPVATHEDITVDEDGHVWGPLSFDNPQMKINGDGTVTVKKLGRAYHADGTMEEIPLTAILYPKRVPISSVKTVKDVYKDPKRLGKHATPRPGMRKRPGKNKGVQSGG